MGTEARNISQVEDTSVSNQLNVEVRIPSLFIVAN